MEVKNFLKFRYISDQKKNENIFYITLPLTISFYIQIIQMQHKNTVFIFCSKNIEIPVTLKLSLSKYD